MINTNKAMLLILMIVLISSCAAYAKKTASASVSELTVCDEPRPQICTSEYNPVCASYNNGRKKTESTGCTACAIHEVNGYIMGVCKTDIVD